MMEGQCSDNVCSTCGKRVFHVLPMQDRYKQRDDIVFELLRQTGPSTCEELRAAGGFKHVGDAVAHLLKQRRITKHQPRLGERYPFYTVVEQAPDEGARGEP
jgi:hypothetical protein